MASSVSSVSSVEKQSVKAEKKARGILPLRPRLIDDIARSILISISSPCFFCPALLAPYAASCLLFHPTPAVEGTGLHLS